MPLQWRRFIRGLWQNTGSESDVWSAGGEPSLGVTDAAPTSALNDFCRHQEKRGSIQSFGASLENWLTGRKTSIYLLTLENLVVRTSLDEKGYKVTVILIRKYKTYALILIR